MPRTHAAVLRDLLPSLCCLGCAVASCPAPPRPPCTLQHGPLRSQPSTNLAESKASAAQCTCIRVRVLSRLRQAHGVAIIVAFVVDAACKNFIFCQFWKRRAQRNDEDPFNKIFKIMDMRPISIKKHEWNFANMVPRSTTKHKMTFFNWIFQMLVILGSILCDPWGGPKMNNYALGS